MVRQKGTIYAWRALLIGQGTTRRRQCTNWSGIVLQLWWQWSPDTQMQTSCLWKGRSPYISRWPKWHPHQSALTSIAIEQVCELEADLTAIPPREFVRKRATDGTLYYKLLYSIGMTFRNTIAFELIFNGKTYETVFAKYAWVGTIKAWDGMNTNITGICFNLLLDRWTQM